MPKRFINRSTFSEETPFLDVKPVKNISINESRNIMHMIIDIKLQAQLEAHSQKKLKTDQSPIKEENIIQRSDKSQNLSIKGSKLLSTKGLPLKGRKLIEKFMEDDFVDNETTIYPNLLETLLRKMILSAETVKKSIKKLKGLNLDEQFVLVNVHKCEYCNREFSKPCSLGGHISKVHSREQKKDLRMGNDLELVIARGQ